jgi:uncharacterized membrane protein YhiD involved in acid resistance
LNQGEAITDVDTGELLGGAEIQVGMIEVMSVARKLSKAKIISGAGQIGIGDICRLQKSIRGDTEAAYPRVTPGW